jgi:hypothetical protein
VGVHDGAQGGRPRGVIVVFLLLKGGLKMGLRDAMVVDDDE